MTKRKLSVSVAEDVLRLLDRAAVNAGTTRSGMVDVWLRRAARADLEHELRVATIEYYEALTRAEQAEELAIASASSRAARRLSIDGPGRGRVRR